MCKVSAVAGLIPKGLKPAQPAHMTASLRALCCWLTLAAVHPVPFPPCPPPLQDCARLGAGPVFLLPRHHLPCLYWLPHHPALLRGRDVACEAATGSQQMCCAVLCCAVLRCAALGCLCCAAGFLTHLPCPLPPIAPAGLPQGAGRAVRAAGHRSAAGTVHCLSPRRSCLQPPEQPRADAPL